MLSTHQTLPQTLPRFCGTTLFFTRTQTPRYFPQIQEILRKADSPESVSQFQVPLGNDVFVTGVTAYPSPNWIPNYHQSQAESPLPVDRNLVKLMDAQGDTAETLGFLQTTTVWTGKITPAFLRGLYHGMIPKNDAPGQSGKKIASLLAQYSQKITDAFQTNTSSTEWLQELSGVVSALQPQTRVILLPLTVLPHLPLGSTALPGPTNTLEQPSVWKRLQERWKRFDRYCQQHHWLPC